MTHRRPPYGRRRQVARRRRREAGTDFDAEVRANVRYEQGLAVKAAIAVVLVLIVIGLRLVFLH